MTSMASKLTKENLEQIAEYMVGKFPVLRQRSRSAPRSLDVEIEIRERVVRVEEELKNVHLSIRDLLVYIEKRFEQVDKRFEQVDKRFEDVNRRFTMMMWFAGLGFTITTAFITGAMVMLK